MQKKKRKEKKKKKSEEKERNTMGTRARSSTARKARGTLHTALHTALRTAPPPSAASREPRAESREQTAPQRPAAATRCPPSLCCPRSHPQRRAYAPPSPLPGSCWRPGGFERSTQLRAGEWRELWAQPTRKKGRGVFRKT